MNVFIVYAHPEQRSFNAALHKAAKETITELGHDLVISDLYRMEFEPVASNRDFLKEHKGKHPRFREEQEKAFNRGLLASDISEEQEKLKWCDLLILQFPLWWFSMPAILKGWIDRVLTPGFAYSQEKFYNHGGLRGKKAMVLLTTGGSQQRFSRFGLNGPIDVILFPIHHGILYYVGFEVLPPFVVWHPSRLSEKGRKDVLMNLSTYLSRFQTLKPLQFPLVEDSDANEELRGGLDWASILNLASKE
jgi:NAD(P)H dehydrogenase (quinone)